MSGKQLCFCIVTHNEFDPHTLKWHFVFSWVFFSLAVSGARQKEFSNVLQDHFIQTKVLRVEFKWERLHCHSK